MAEPERRIVFATLAESLVRGLGADLTPSLAAKLKARGLDLSRPFPPGWEAELMFEWLVLIATETYPSVSQDEALRRLGHRFIEGWRATLLGAATAQMMRVMGSRRALARVGRAFRTGDNFTQASVEFTGPNQAYVTIIGAPLPSYLQGIMEAGTSMVGLTGTVVVRSFDGRAVVLQVDWEA
jgi:uncharacterized protein (TIGR02265 family)